MHDLRLIGVHEDGEHLLLADDGTRYLLAIDEALRAAVRRPATARTAAPVPVGAREVQSLIRAGISPEEVAERAGWTAAKVAVFSTPVLAERSHVAGLARESRLRTRGGTTGPERLHTRVERRLTGRGVSAGDAEWDATREEGDAWHVHVVFIAGGRQRRASWRYDGGADVAEALDDEARWLSEDEAADGPIPTPHRVAGEHVFDVEAVGGVIESERPAGVGPGRSDRTDALMTAIREHSHAGERRGARRPRAASPGRDAGPYLPTEADDTPTPAAAPAGPVPDELVGLDLAGEDRDVLPQDRNAGPEEQDGARDDGTARNQDREVNVPGQDTSLAPAAADPGPEPGLPREADARPAREADTSLDVADASDGESGEAGYARAGEPHESGGEPGARPAEAEATPPGEPDESLEVADARLAGGEATPAGEPDESLGVTDARPAEADPGIGEPDTNPADADPGPAETAVSGAATTEPPAAAGATATPPAAQPSSSRRRGRVGVPDWNDVMFGPSRTDS